MAGVSRERVRACGAQSRLLSSAPAATLALTSDCALWDRVWLQTNAAARPVASASALACCCTLSQASLTHAGHTAALRCYPLSRLIAGRLHARRGGCTAGNSGRQQRVAASDAAVRPHPSHCTATTPAAASSLRAHSKSCRTHRRSSVAWAAVLVRAADRRPLCHARLSRSVLLTPQQQRRQPRLRRMRRRWCDWLDK